MHTPVKITHGYSKDKRADLKQFVLSLLCVDDNVPIVGQREDANASDKTINHRLLSEVSNHMQTHGVGEDAFIYIADSAAHRGAGLDPADLLADLAAHRAADAHRTPRPRGDRPGLGQQADGSPHRLHGDLEIQRHHDPLHRHAAPPGKAVNRHRARLPAGVTGPRQLLYLLSTGWRQASKTTPASMQIGCGM